jgi:hypothetical protein
LQYFPVVEEVLIRGILTLLHEEDPEFVSHPLIVRLLLILKFFRVLEELAELLYFSDFFYILKYVTYLGSLCRGLPQRFAS